MSYDPPRYVKGYRQQAPTRWTKADNGRLLPLNSRAWIKLRKSVLAEEPLCQYCPPGVVTPATEVDHANNNPADNTRSNLVSACKSCHSRKTAADMHGRPQRLGCDEQGYPISPSHHWNKAAVARSGGTGGDDGEQKSPEALNAEPTLPTRAHQST